MRVYPYIREMSAYTLLRPFFRAKQERSAVGRDAYLAAENWDLDTESADFPNAPPGRSQEYNDETHPHLELDRTMVSIPEVRPGDQAWWHAGEHSPSCGDGNALIAGDRHDPCR